MKKKIFFCIALIVTLACNRKNETEEKTDTKLLKDTITINENSPILSKIKTAKIVPTSYKYKLTTSGTVKAIPNNYALIAAPFAGRITKSFVRLGQEVNEDSPIFEISSPAYFETGKVYYQAKEEMFLALKNLKRQKDLLAKGVGIQKDVEEAEVNYAITKKDYENALASLKVFQVDTANLVLGQPLIVRSPIKGTIVSDNIVIGQYIKEDSDPIATVAELSKVWVAGQVKEKDIRYINDSMEVNISLLSFPNEKIDGHIYHINSIIDEDTRSVQVLVECNNSNRKMKPGMYVTVNFINEIKDAIMIPSNAIFQKNDNSFVYLQADKNRFVKQKIEILTTNKDSAVIKTGLKPDDDIITDGGFYLMEAE